MEWVKRNKIATAIILVLLLIIAKTYLLGISYPVTSMDRVELGMPAQSSLSYGIGAPTKIGIPPIIRDNYSPVQAPDRLVVQESSISLVVSNVRETSNKITEHATGVGGYMVNSHLSQPEEAPYSNVVVRVPSDKLKETLDYYRSLAMKVSSEDISGYDVTDQYVDIEERVKTLESTKVKFEDLLEKSVSVQDTLNVQRELINLQDQIDSLKGRQNYLEQTAKLVRINIYLSSDELALPYAPTNTFRPEVIFKLAVRSLVQNLRDLASMFIWIAVYSVVWLPILILVLLVLKWRKGKTSGDK